MHISKHTQSLLEINLSPRMTITKPNINTRSRSKPQVRMPERNIITRNKSTSPVQRNRRSKSAPVIEQDTTDTIGKQIAPVIEQDINGNVDDQTAPVIKINLFIDFKIILTKCATRLGCTCNIETKLDDELRITNIIFFIRFFSISWMQSCTTTWETQLRGGEKPLCPPG